MAEFRNPPNDFPLQLKTALQQVPVKGLPHAARQLLSQSLNRLSIRVADSSGMIRDYRGLAEGLDFEYSDIHALSKGPDPMETLLNRWQRKRGATIGKLMELLEKMERFDVLDDLRPIFINNLYTFMNFISTKEPMTEQYRAMEAEATAFGLNYKSRPSWGAFYSKQNNLIAVNPVRLVFIHHTVTCGEPIDVVRRVQVSKILIYGHDDVVSNMMVGEDGTVFEGRGWDYSGSHTRRYNSVAYSIGLLGNYEENEPDPRMMAAAQKVIEFGVHLGKIAPDYGLYAHCDASVTQSPGKYVIQQLKFWPKYHAFGRLPTPEELTSEDFISDLKKKFNLSEVKEPQ